MAVLSTWSSSLHPARPASSGGRRPAGAAGLAGRLDQHGKPVADAVDLEAVHGELVVARSPPLAQAADEHEAFQVQHEVVEVTERLVLRPGGHHAASSSATSSSSEAARALGAGAGFRSVRAISAPTRSRPVST